MGAPSATSSVLPFTVTVTVLICGAGVAGGTAWGAEV